MTSLHRYLIRIAIAILAFSGILAAAQTQQVVMVKLDDTINPITEEFVDRAIAHADQIHAEAVLIELSTPGGLVDSTRGIISKMLAAKVPVIVYVTPTGSRAASAGFYILEAADIAAMSPGTNTGAAHPVLLGEKMDDIMKKKVENDSAAFMRSFVSKRGRNVDLAESAVRESKSWTDQEALQNHLIDVVAKDPADLWKQLDGRTITRFDGTKQTLHLNNVQLVDYKETLREEILGWLMDPNIAFLVLALGALALYAEFNHPGAVIPGVVGLIAIILAVFALNLLPVRYASFVLILAAFVMFALEAKFMTHGVLGIGGVIALTLGGLLLVDGPIPEMRVQWWAALGVSVPLGAITIFLMTLAIKAHRNKVVTGEQGLVGEVGVARTPLSPEGKVFVHGELWNAVSSEPVALGESVVVNSMHDFTLEVTPAPKTQPASAN
ncbi:MAG: nodulation protein NfeD [Terriglobia bacterium]|nr:nodulation protein NfeD [Terriglobia bacterium]